MASLSSAKRGRGVLALHEAVRNCDVPRVASLIGYRAPLTEIDSYGRTPLHLAVVGEEIDAEIVQEMVATLLSVDEEEDAAFATAANSVPS